MFDDAEYIMTWTQMKHLTTKKSIMKLQQMDHLCCFVRATNRLQVRFERQKAMTEIPC